jgi:phage minor structural protein
MLILYDISHVKIDGLTNYKELKLDMEINIEDNLSFVFPVSDPKHDLILEECYIRTEDNEYIVKEVNFNDDDWTEYICKINIEGIKGKDVSHFETVEQSCTNSVNLALVGTGWLIGTCDVTKLRTVRKNNCTAYIVLQEIQSAYGCEMSFDSINKKVYIYQSMGSDKGTYFAEQLNLKKLDIQRNSYDYITRLIPLGKDGLGIASINGGLNYVQNYQYSNKIITAYWEDNRYTDTQSLLEDGIVRLDYLSKPYKAYKVDVIDLANINN